MIKLIVLGSGSCIPFPGRGNSGYLIDIDNHLLLVDGGSGALRRVADYGYDYRDIEYVFYTHLHPDHIYDFIPYLFALKNDQNIQGDYSVNVYAPVGFSGLHQSLLEVFGHWVESERLLLNITESELHEDIRLPFADVSTGPVRHSENSIAYRFKDTDGNTLVYSGDTGYSEEFATFAQFADLMIVETAIPEAEDFDKHSSPSDAAKMAAEANVKEVIFTHFYPVMEEVDVLGIAKQYFHGKMAKAFDGMRIELGNNSDE